MAKFLNSSGTTYHLEELIKNASDRLIIISPYLKLNDRIKELLEDRNRLKIDIRVVYGKNDLQPEEIKWLKNLAFIRTSFCKNLHAKCYLNENECIITSLNLYEFSQVNNNEMGVLIYRNEDVKLYSDAYEEAQRIIRISEEVRMSLETVISYENKKEIISEGKNEKIEKDIGSPSYSKLTTSKLAKELGLKTEELNDKLLGCGYLEKIDDELILTDAGISAGGVSKKGRFKGYFLWDAGMVI